MLKDLSKRITSMALAGLLVFQMGGGTAVLAEEPAESSAVTITSDATVNTGEAVQVEAATHETAAQSEDSSSEASDDVTDAKVSTAESANTDAESDKEEQNIDPDTVYTVTIDPAGGTLPKEWIETANSNHMPGAAEGTVSVTEENGILTVKARGLLQLVLMSPTPADDTQHFDSWQESEGSHYDSESNTFVFDSSVTEYALTAIYASVEEESKQVENARTYTDILESERGSSGISTFALKPTDDFTPIQLAMEGMEFVYEDGQIQTFTAPYDGEYIITAYGANGGTGYAKYAGYGVPGRGGMTEATVNLKQGQTIYLYLGEAGGDWSTERTLGGGGAGVDLDHAWVGYDDNSLHVFGRGGGATYVSIDEFNLANAGQAQWDFTDEQKAQNDAAAEEAKNHIIMVAAGGGGAGEMGSPYSHYGLPGGGYEGGILRHHNQYYLPMEQVGQVSYDATVGGRTLTREERLEAWIWPATQTRAGYGLHYSILGNLYDPNPANKDPIELLYPEREARNWGSFFFGSNAMACTGAGGGGWFGGGTDYSFDGGGGSSYIGTKLTAPDGTVMNITDAETVTGANVKYDDTKSSPFYVNGRVLIRLKDGEAKINAILQKAADEDISKEHIDTITGDEYGQGVTFPVNVTESNETVGYTAVIYYTPGPEVMGVVPQWEYSSFTDTTFKEWNDKVAKSINSDLEVKIKNTELGVLEPGDKYYKEEYADRNVIVTTMTISNVYLKIFDPANLVGYRFRAGAVGSYALSSGTGTVDAVTENDGGLTTRSVYEDTPDAPFYMHHMGVNTYNNVNNINVSANTKPANSTSFADVEKNTKGREHSTWAYPDLVVEAPDVLRTFNVLFTSPSRHANDCINYDKNLAKELGITVKGINQNYIFLQKDGLNKEQWMRFLRAVTFTTYDPLVVKSDGVEGGVGIEWAGFEEAIGVDSESNDDYPKLSDYSNVINHNIGSGNLNITQSGRVYHVTGSTSTYRIDVASGVTTTIFLDNVTMSTDVRNTDANKRGNGCITCSGANLTLVLMGTSKLTSNGEGSNAITKNGTGGELIIDGDGTLYASGNENVFHAGAIGATAHFELHNLTIRGGTIVARAGEHCPGIGSGCQKLCKNIKIEGGAVYAYGNDDCSGIGSGLGGPVDGIYISNGAKVTAYGGGESPGIGSGGAGTTGDYPDSYDANYHFHTSNIIISGGNTVVTAYGDRTSKTPGIGCGFDNLHGRKSSLTNVIAQTENGFQGYVRYGSSEENAQYSTAYPKTPFVGVGDMGNYLAQQADAGKAVYYTQVFFSLDKSKKTIGDADIIGTQVEKTYADNPDLPSISGVVWAENDHNGIYAFGEEPAMEGVEVALVLKTGQVLQKVTTSSSGQYVFPEVSTGEYYLRFTVPNGTIPDGHEVTLKVPGKDGSVTNSVNDTYRSDVFTVKNGEPVDSINCGIFVPSSISGYVWDDTNKDGIYDDGEKKLEGLNVELQLNGTTATDADGNPLKTTTNGNGEYVFTNVPSSMTAYDVIITGSNAVDISKATVSPIPAKDTPAEKANAASQISMGDISATVGLEKAAITNLYIKTVGKDFKAVDLTYKNCALYVRNSIYGYVWAETDRNGILDGASVAEATDNLLPNIKVVLVNKDGTEVKETISSKGGYYEFTGVEPGDYYVKFYAGEDFDGNGKIDAANSLVAFRESVLPKQDENQGKIINGAVGENFITSQNDVPKPQNFTSDIVKIKAASIVGNSQEASQNVNAALFVPSSIFGKVWEDYNQDGIYQDTEEYLNGVKVSLYKYVSGDKAAESSYEPVQMGNNKPATIQTNQWVDLLTGEVKEYTGTDGIYDFRNLPSGTYMVKFESGDLDLRYYIASPSGNDSDGTATYTADGEEFIKSVCTNIVIPEQKDMPQYGFREERWQGLYQKLRDVTVTKQIKAEEINWAYGEPAFLISVYGTDPLGQEHAFTHLFAFDKDYVKQNTDENGMVSISYLFEGIPYAHVYNVKEVDNTRYTPQQVSGSENVTVQDNVAAIDLKYEVEGSVTFTNNVKDYKDTSHNDAAVNKFKASLQDIVLTLFD